MKPISLRLTKSIYGPIELGPWCYRRGNTEEALILYHLSPLMAYM